mgnify:CR=1 FL=1
MQSELFASQRVLSSQSGGLGGRGGGGRQVGAVAQRANPVTWTFLTLYILLSINTNVILVLKAH